MSFRSNKTRALWLAVALSLSIPAAYFAHAGGVPASEGIVNFGKISDSLYRGAQPDEAGLENLHRLGIKTVINLRMADDAWKEEEARAIAHGLVYTNVPFRGMGRPTDDQVKTVLSLIETLPGPVFIHCRRGSDRTGTIVACYRMKHDLWSLEKAVAEANLYGMSIFERGMKKFVVDFAKAFVAQQAVAKNP